MQSLPQHPGLQTLKSNKSTLGFGVGLNGSDRGSAVLNAPGVDAPPRRWLDVQTDTLTRWVNVHLGTRKLKVNNLFQDLRYGDRLIDLLEILADKSLGMYNIAPTTMKHAIENHTIAMEYLKTEGIVDFDIPADELARGNKAYILSLIWNLVLFYTIRGGLNAWELIMNWVRLSCLLLSLFVWFTFKCFTLPCSCLT